MKSYFDICRLRYHRYYCTILAPAQGDSIDSLGMWWNVILFFLLNLKEQARSCRLCAWHIKHTKDQVVLF